MDIQYLNQRMWDFYQLIDSQCQQNQKFWMHIDWAFDIFIRKLHQKIFFSEQETKKLKKTLISNKKKREKEGRLKNP